MFAMHDARQRNQNSKDDKEDKKTVMQVTPYKAKPHVAALHDDVTEPSVEKQRSRVEQRHHSQQRA